MYNTAPFVKLGDRLRLLLSQESGRESLYAIADKAVEANGWFTSNGIVTAIENITEYFLDDRRIEEWLSRYPEKSVEKKNIGVIMAGNIPLVGFFDLMCTVICGHRCFYKLSSKDRVLMDYVISLLRDDNPGIEIYPLEDQTLLDAVIATGSDNANRYFNTLYGGIPTLLRGTRNSVALLSGDENESRLEALGDDMFTYSGLGCRNVSKIFIPEDFDLRQLVEALAKKRDYHSKYFNSYRLHRAMLTMHGEEFIDCGFFTLRECDGWPQSLTDILYSRYKLSVEVDEWLLLNDSKIQCVVSDHITHPRQTPLGTSQRPHLSDYPDGADIVKFLNSL